MLRRLVKEYGDECARASAGHSPAGSVWDFPADLVEEISGEKIAQVVENQRIIEQKIRLVRDAVEEHLGLFGQATDGLNGFLNGYKVLGDLGNYLRVLERHVQLIAVIVQAEHQTG